MSRHVEALRKLELIEGEQVLVTRTARSGEGGWQDTWLSSMDDLVGKMCTVDDVGDDFVIIAAPDGHHYAFPGFVLKKIKPKVISRASVSVTIDG